MQVMNMSQPVMRDKATSSTLATNSTDQEEVESPFQSLLQASNRNNQSEGSISIEEDATLININTDTQLAEELAGLLEGTFGKNVSETILKQLQNGSSLREIVKTLDMETVEQLMKATPKLTEAFPFLADFVGVSRVDTGSQKKDIVIKDTAPQMPLSMKEWVPNDLKAKIQHVLKDISELLHAFKTDGKLNKADSSKMADLLKQWSLMIRQAKDADIHPQKLQQQMLDDQESDLWNKLLQRFEKRSFLAGKNMYAQNAQVTKQDVMNWLQQAIENQAVQNKPNPFTFHESQMPMTRVEQHMIHMEHTGRVERIGSAFIDKFANIIRESQFISRSGKLELNLMLKPNHLGHINVKMTQINGEMMVKLLVSSQASKEMLEQNMHQLRHLFSPHQVTVERNEAVTDEEFYFNEEKEDQHQEEHSDDRHEDERNNDEDNTEFDFETIFNHVSEEEER